MNNRTIDRKPRSSRMLVVLALLAWSGEVVAADILDAVVFGDAMSEQAHAFTSDGSEVVASGGGASARRLLPRSPPAWEGGWLRVTVRVDPTQQTYLTARFWGDETSRSRIVAYIDGRQLGYRHLGDVEILDIGVEEPPAPGRFCHVTTPLPLALTRGRETVVIELRGNGRIWGYGRDFAQYQKVMEAPTRGVGALYTHRDGFFVPPATAPVVMPTVESPPPRQHPDARILDDLRARVRGEATKLLTHRPPLDQMQAHFLAKAHALAWTPAHADPRVLTQVVAAVDAYCARLQQDPKLVHEDPATWNRGWFGVGPLGDAVRILAQRVPDGLAAALDQPLGQHTRRAAWTTLFTTSRDWLRANRRQYTNQTMIIDLNLYRCDRALRVVSPDSALPEAEALRYVHEAVGLRPWLGSDTPTGPARPLGDGFFQLTRAGLTRELGYVGYYGEVLDWMLQLYEATTDAQGHGDPALKAQLLRAATARSFFRYPTRDADGFRAMRIENVIGWRDDHLPGGVTYGMRGARDASCIALAGLVRDATTLGHVQQQLADGQLHASLAAPMRENGLRVTIGLMSVPDDLAWITAQPASGVRLPFAPGEPDRCFVDAENGVVALRHGDEMLYVSLYWRARHAINHLARVHHLTPQGDRIAVVRQETDFIPADQTWRRPDWTNFGFANGGLRYPGAPPSAHAGEELPIAAIPAGMPYRVGQEHLHAGRGTRYQLRFGRYEIALNMSDSQTVMMRWPEGVARARDLVAGRTLSRPVDGRLALPPLTAVVLVDEPGR